MISLPIGESRIIYEAGAHQIGHTYEYVKLIKQIKTYYYECGGMTDPMNAGSVTREVPKECLVGRKVDVDALIAHLKDKKLLEL